MDEKTSPEIVKVTNDFSAVADLDAAQIAALEGRSQRAAGGSFFSDHKKSIIAICAVLLLTVGAVVWQLRTKETSVNSTVGSDAVNVQIPEGSDHVFVNDTSGVSSDPTTDADNASQDAINMGSENFKLKEVTFGTGSVALYSGESENMPLAISDVHSEVLTGNNDANVKLLVTWKTDKLARSTVKYDKGGAARTLSEGGYGFSHALVLANLERATRYTFNIVGIDRWGNAATSDTFNAYVGNKSASVFELIAQQFSDMFGWAAKK